MSRFRQHFASVRLSGWSVERLFELTGAIVACLLLTSCIAIAMTRPLNAGLPSFLALFLISIAVILRSQVVPEKRQVQFQWLKSWGFSIVWSVLLAVTIHWSLGPVFLLVKELIEMLKQRETSHHSHAENLEPQITEPESTQEDCDELIEDSHDCSNEELLLALCDENPSSGDSDLITNPECSFSGNAVRQVVYLQSDNDLSVVATIRQSFPAGERIQVLHLPFFPPLSESLDVSSTQMDGPEASIRVTDISRFGLRAELKLVAASLLATEVLVEFQISSAIEQNLSAAG